MMKLKKYFFYFLIFSIPLFAILIYQDEIKNNFYKTLIKQGFVVKNINIQGVDFFDKNEIIKVININNKSPIFLLDLNDLLARLLLNISWIKNVQIQRKYPNSIIITIKEREPICYFQKQADLYLIDKEGVLIKSKKTIKNGIIIAGNNGNKMAFNLLETLKKYNITNIVSASYIGSRRWNLEMDNEVIVKLPENDLEHSISKLKTLIDEKNILKKNINLIDLRLSNKILIKENRSKLNYKEV